MAKKTKDPRLADISSGSNAAADMPTAKPAPVKKKTKNVKERLAQRQQAQAASRSTAPAATSTKLDESDLPPAVLRRRRMRWANRPEWLTTFLTACAVALFAWLVYDGINRVVATLAKNQRDAVVADTWKKLLENNVTVKGTPDKVDENGIANFPFLSFEAVRDKQQINQNLRLASTLPGITEIRISPPAPLDDIAQGSADLSTLSVISENFPNLKSLDLSSTQVIDLQKLETLRLDKLVITNTPIRREKLASLEILQSVTDLGIGWTAETKNPNYKQFSSDIYRARVLDAIVKLRNLKNLYLLNFPLSAEEKQRLPPGINIVVWN